MTKNYREAYGLFACNGILFNHESERRGETFVTRKITRGLSKIKHGKEAVLYLGNLDAKRDWGYAKDYVEGMWRMLQCDEPDDYVLATGETHSVREFLKEACTYVDIDLGWKGKGLNEVGFDKQNGEIFVKIDPVYFRPSEVDILIGDASKAKKKLGWEATVKFKELVRIMMEHDLSDASGVRNSRVSYKF